MCHGIDLEAHTAHHMSADDVAWADLILAMEGYQCARVRQRWPEGAYKTHLIGDFFDEGPFLIADPYGQDDATFAAIFDKIASGIEALASKLEAGDVRLGSPSASGVEQYGAVQIVGDVDAAEREL
jgi:protein-tyrosine-phosphatase